MTSYVYKQTEPELWTVGYYAPDGTWCPEHDHSSRGEAAARVRYLNGGSAEGTVESPVRPVRVFPLSGRWSWQCLVPGCRQSCSGLDTPVVAHIGAEAHTCTDVIGMAEAGTDQGVLTVGVVEGWADGVTDPTLINWAVRQVAALLPFAVISGRPVTPGPRTGIYGRSGLGRWGENPMADAVITATWQGVRYLLLIERRDGHGWALPGGSITRGETSVDAATRELYEETGLHVYSEAGWVQRPPQYVPDPRGTDESWAVTVPCTYDLGAVDVLPPVSGGDDAADAAWIPATDYSTLVESLKATGRKLFSAHTMLVLAVLEGAR